MGKKFDRLTPGRLTDPRRICNQRCCLTTVSGKSKRVKKQFLEVSIRHIPRGENACTDALAKLASMRTTRHLRSVIQETLALSSVQLKVAPTPSINTGEEVTTWMDPTVKYIEFGSLPPNAQEDTQVSRRAPSYSVIEGRLYRSGFLLPLLKCIVGRECLYILTEIHEGIYRQHLGKIALAKNSLRAGYY